MTVFLPAVNYLDTSDLTNRNFQITASLPTLPAGEHAKFDVFRPVRED